MKKITQLIADEGKIITNGEIYGKVIILAENETADSFYEITEEEYEKVVDYMYLSGIEDGFLQELSSAREEYTPDFNLYGV